MMQSKKQEEIFFEMCADGDVDEISEFVDNGFDINVTDVYGHTPLYIACRAGYLNLVRYLVNHGANIYALNKKGLTLRQIALKDGYSEIAEYLASFEELSLEVEVKENNGNQNNVIKSKKLTKKEKKQQNKNAQNAQKTVIVPQKNVAIQMPQVQQITNQTQNQNFDGQQNNVSIIRTDNEIYIYEYSNNPAYYTETILFRDCQGCPPLGIYYRTANGLDRYNGKLVSNYGLAMYNPLLNLKYASDALAKMYGDMRHGFSTEVENQAGDWARIVINNAINDPYQMLDGVKEFKIFVTIPGQINEVDNSRGQAIVTNQLTGVFEFTIKKNLYKKKGECFHRFFAPKGIVGEDEFGAKAQSKRMNQ